MSDFLTLPVWLDSRTRELSTEGRDIFERLAQNFYCQGLIDKANVKDFYRVCNLYGTFLACRQNPNCRQLAETTLSLAEMAGKRIGLNITHDRIEPDRGFLYAQKCNTNFNTSKI